MARILDAMPIDAILLDLMLPHGRTGFEIFDEIRTAPQLNSVPVVLVTAADASATVPIAVEKGFAGFIAKPIDYTLFPRQIAAVINGESVWSIG
jgi:CheY-like chemotaxis protein